ncbi:MAG: hypothetical protein KA956_00510 [Pyrinomonadaceae bacterium]|nr:hypothetical protein [Acidobacteriota bacterium]MBP7374933.1 hypothetical protein [Pyrinomonadaceae bacterium]
MRPIIFIALLFIVSAIPISAQKTLVIYDPTIELLDELPMLPDAEQAVFEQSVLPKLKAKYQSDGCAVDPELAGEVSGKFTKKGAVQKAAFYQVCQTGNGLGTVAIVIFENDKLVGIWGDQSGWTLQINSIRDLNANGLDEFSLSFGGGMHQGQGGIGVDVMEFSNGKPRSIGWFQAEKIMDTETESAWKVTVRTGKAPVFYRQKFVANRSGKLVRSGANSVFKPRKVESNFEGIK